MEHLEGKVAVITGAASGIGLGMARAFGAAGMKLVVADLDDERMVTAADEFAAKGIVRHPLVAQVVKAYERPTEAPGS